MVKTATYLYFVHAGFMVYKDYVDGSLYAYPRNPWTRVDGMPNKPFMILEDTWNHSIAVERVMIGEEFDIALGECDIHKITLTIPTLNNEPKMKRGLTR